MRHQLAMPYLASALLMACSWAHAEQRMQWNTESKVTATPVDDSALEAVSGKGSLEDQAVKALQNGTKINEVLSTLGQLTHPSTLAIDSADKQATQTQLRLAQNATQTVNQTLQINSTVSFMAAPVSPAPFMGLPALGLPMLPK